ncbi:dhx8 [Symbiodinium microadriaticum]|nr:dhx8 [Symbiodinium microadriaticum]
MKEFFETKAANKDKDGNSCIISVAGRTHDVDILYLESPTHNFLQRAVQTVLDIHRGEDWGDVLVFLPGSEDIDNAVRLLEDMYDKPDLIALPLYSSLPQKLQMRVFEPTPPKHRKVVFATNIAETSVTIEGIKFIVDSGFTKMKYFDPESGVDSLICCSISQAAAWLVQRAGRAGRTQSGKCFRLMTESSFQSLLPSSPPEMQRTDISWVVLQLKALGIDDVLHFDFLSPPPVKLMLFALELLFSLGALDSSCHITAIGEQMAEMPVEPRLAKALLSSVALGCTEETLSIAAMCSIDHPFISMRTRANDEAKQRLLDCKGELSVAQGDHLTLLNIYNCYEQSGHSSSWCDSMCLQSRLLSRAREVRGKLRGMLKRMMLEGEVMSSCGEDNDTIMKSIVSGYFANVAQLGSGGMYWTVRGRIPVNVHPTSVIARFGSPPEWVVFHDVVHTDTILIREVSRIQPMWLIELAEHYYDSSKVRT